MGVVDLAIDYACRDNKYPASVDVLFVEEPHKDDEVGPLGSLKQCRPARLGAPLNRVATAGLNGETNGASTLHRQYVDGWQPPRFYKRLKLLS